MYPILFSLGPLHIFSLSVFLILAWIVFSFLFWRALRRWGVAEDRIFDLTFYATLTAVVAARAGFVLLNLDLFVDDTFLKILAVWVAPGFWFYAGLTGALATLVFLTRRSKVRLGLVLDAVAAALPVSLIVAKIGSLLDGAEVGKLADLPWALRYVGYAGRRHPVQLYEIGAIMAVAILVAYLIRRSEREKWPYGLVGVWFFAVFSPLMFLLEFVKEASVYWLSVSVNQWVLIGFFAEAIGALYVRGGGREVLRPAARTLVTKLKKGALALYAKIPRRRFRGDQTAS